MSNAAAAKRLILSYQTNARKSIDQIKAIDADAGRTAESKRQMIRAITEKLTVDFQSVAAKLDALVQSATEQFTDNRPSAVQRRIAMRDAAGTARASGIRELLRGASNEDLFQTAQEARHANDDAAAHGVRLELAARMRADLTSTVDRHRRLTPKLAQAILDELAFPRLLDKEQGAIRELVCTRVLVAGAKANGPLLSEIGPSFIDAARKITAFREATTVTTETGHVRQYMQRDVDEMMDALEAGLPARAAVPKDTPSDRITRFRKLQAEEAETEKAETEVAVVQ